MQNESKDFLPRFSSISVNTNLYCCHHVWIGPGKIPTEAIFKLHDKYHLYQGIEEQFIPTLCLNEDAICNLQFAR